jgi:hypothetical protein
MKKFALIAFAAACLSAQGVNRIINESWNVARTPLLPQNVWFLMAESVEFNLTCTLGTDPYPLTNDNLIVVWEISQGDNYTNLYAAGTGSVTSATGGVVRLNLTPEQSNLEPGTYNGYVIAATMDGTNITSRVVLARQNLIVGWSPYGLELTQVSTLSPYYTRGEINVMTNTLWEAIAASVDTNAAHSVTMNGVEYPSVDGVIDLGTISGSPTNVQVSLPGGVTIYGPSETSITVDFPGTSFLDGTYVCTNGLATTNRIFINGDYTVLYDPSDSMWWFYNTVDEAWLASSTNGTLDSPALCTNWDSSVAPTMAIGINPDDSIAVSGSPGGIFDGDYETTNGLYGSGAVYSSTNGYDIVGDANAYWTLTPTDQHETILMTTYEYSYPSPPYISFWFYYDDTEDYTNVVTSGEVKMYDLTNAVRMVESRPVSLGDLSVTGTLTHARLTNFISFVTAPTGSVASGSAGQYSVSSDTNQFFYWYSPTAVSGSKTGIWLRVLGESFD